MKLFVWTLTLTSIAFAQKPLTIASQGSFFVGGEYKYGCFTQAAESWHLYIRDLTREEHIRKRQSILANRCRARRSMSKDGWRQVREQVITASIRPKRRAGRYCYGRAPDRIRLWKPRIDQGHRGE